MRQFLLAKSVAYGSGANPGAIANGAVAFAYNNNGVFTVDNTGAGITKEGMLVLGRTGEAGPVVLPVFKNNFSYVKGVYQAATTFSANVTVTAPTKVGDYSLIIVKKGTKFNERNKWTAMVHVTDTTMTAAKLAEALVKAIKHNGANSGVTASNAGATITITASNAGEDYTVLGADNLFGITVTIASIGMPAYGSASYVADLAAKAAADAGIEYPFQDYTEYMYPTFPLNPLAQPDATDVGYTIFTLRFAEPRDVKTRDEVVNQIIQVAFPTGAAAITTFEKVCKGLSGISDD